MKHHIIPAVAIGMLSISSASAAITDIFAGDSVGLSGITVAEDPSLAGVVAIDFAQDFAVGDPAGDLLTGVLDSRVVIRNDTGEIDFYWRLRDLDSESTRISSIVLSGFEGWDVGVEWRVDSVGDIGPAFATRTADDDSIGYLFNAPFLHGPNESKYFLARTSAMDFDLIGTAQINLISGESVTLATFAPQVPTPGGAVLLGTGGLLATRRRR